MKLHILKQNFAERIGRDPKFRLSVLFSLYSSQTSIEKRLNKTRDLNGAGFSAFHAATLSRLAQKAENGQPFSSEEDSILTRWLPRYWAQFIHCISLWPVDFENVRGASGRVESENKEAA
jgi:hypothetical protein